MTSISNVTVGFGTAGLGGYTYQAMTWALDQGFRTFDTAEADWWYDQATVGSALKDYFFAEEIACDSLQVSTKIPPWSLTSIEDIRDHAAQSRMELLGFCGNVLWEDPVTDNEESIPFPLDIYYIHAPRCWKGWHPRCDDAPKTLNLRDAWLGMEAVAGLDHSAKRIGLSNVHPSQLLDIISFAEERLEAGQINPPPRIPDVLQAYADPLSPSEELRKICQDYGIEFVSYSTLGTQHNKNPNPVLTAPVVVELAQKYSRSAAEVVLSWALQNGMSVIPRSSKKRHIQELGRLLTGPPFLEEEDVEAINMLSDDDAMEL
eukprot:Nitzschia sp. Nitz4//scaffold253_size28098//21626//22655//NITZ4_008144-RA/size28098-snap-gene-0.53-mRNA-1//-1//CDS//3329544309//2287//frame0